MGIKNMKTIITIALIAFGMSATAQSRDSLAKSEHFQSKIWLAASQVAKEVLADTTKGEQHGYAGFIRKEPFNRYWIEQLASGVLINYASSDGNCSDSSLKARIRVIFPEFSKLSGL